MKIGNFFSRLNIRTKLIVLCYSVAFFLSVIFGIFVYSTSKKYTSEKVNESNVNIVQQISKNIDNVRNNSFQISTLICVNPDFQEYMRDTRNETTFPESNIDYINAAGSEISLMIIYNSKGKPVYYRSSDMSTGIHNLSTDEEWDLYNAAVEKEGGPLWIRFSSDSTLFLSRNKQNKLVLLRAIKDIYTMDYLGLMVLCINEQTVQKECAAIYNEGESIIAFNDDDQPMFSYGTIYSTSPSEGIKRDRNSGKSYFTYVSDGIELFTAYAESSEDDWKYYYSIPSSHLAYSLQPDILYACLLILLSLLITYPIARLVVNRLTRPIISLLASMRRFQRGCFDEQVAVTSNDEFGKLQIGYNEMIQKIKKLIDDVYILKIKEHEAELMALQAEINPHFLYNTLDMVYWKAEAQGATELAEIIYCLSRMFRLTLNIGRAITTVAAEKELIECYLNLQKMRFCDKLNYEISIDTDTLQEKLPKLLLQPFVENAVIHGIEPLDSKGKITIRGFLAENRLCFTIEDNGIGISKEKIQELKKHLQNISGQNGSCAIYNIYERLYLYYDDQYMLDIISNPGMGTKIVLIIPKEVAQKGDLR